LPAAQPRPGSFDVARLATATAARIAATPYFSRWKRYAMSARRKYMARTSDADFLRPASIALHPVKLSGQQTHHNGSFL
jgi:hypothetical protein